MITMQALGRVMADPRLMNAEPLCRLLWLGILASVDDQGRMLGQPEFVKAKALPYDAVAADVLENWLVDLEMAGLLVQYVANGLPLLQVAEWWEITSQQFARPSQYPHPQVWADRVRYTPQRSHIVTYNWRTRDGRLLADTCDASGKVLPVKRTSVPTEVLQEAMERTVVVTKVGQNNDVPPPRTAPLPSQVTLADPRKFNGGRVASGKGSTPVEVYYEVVSMSDFALSTSAMERVNRTVQDLAKWREVVERWSLAGFKVGNVAGMLDWYAKGIPTKYQAEGKEVPSVKQHRVAPSGAFEDAS